MRRTLPETHHFLNAENIALLPAGAIVINTARGGLVEDAALIAALQTGRVAAAGLDVFEGEPKINPGVCGADEYFSFAAYWERYFGDEYGYGDAGFG